MISGEVVVVITHRAVGGTDSFGAPTTERLETAISDVLVAPARTTDVDGSIRPDGDKAALTLHFPKTFSDELRGAHVIVRGKEYAVIGAPTYYTAANTPTRWHMPVDVEAVDG